MICRSSGGSDSLKSNECMVIKYKVNKEDGVDGNTYSGNISVRQSVRWEIWAHIKNREGI